MKRRSLSLLSLLAALCLLFTSCAAGLPGAALHAAITDALTAFDAKLDNLFLDNTPLVLDGETEYYVQMPLTVSTELKRSVLTFIEDVKTCTGVTLKQGTAPSSSPSILIGETAHASTASISDRLNPVNFYIGFVGRDLVVHAKNDVMLISALHYLTEYYLKNAEERVGDGYWYLPAELDHLSPVLTCDAKTFTFGRVSIENADWSTNKAINSAWDRISDKTGVKLPITSYSMSKDKLGTQKELIVGKVSREETDAILATLEKNQFYFGANGTKVMILAPNGQALWRGLDTFFATFLDGEGALYNAEEKTWTLPSYCHYYHTYETAFQ